MHYHPSMKAIIFNLPGAQDKVPNDEVGTWAYDATCQDLYPPNRTEPIREAEARHGARFPRLFHKLIGRSKK